MSKDSFIPAIGAIMLGVNMIFIIWKTYHSQGSVTSNWIGMGFGLLILVAGMIKTEGRY